MIIITDEIRKEIEQYLKEKKVEDIFKEIKVKRKV
jgi:transcriptional accessory protein Tex/SPT6